MNSGRAVCLTALALTVATPAFAQVSPELALGVIGVMSVNADIESGQPASSVVDFSDTTVLIGAQQKLYSDWRGSMAVGFQFPDADSTLGQVYFHQIYVQIEDKTNVIKMGRSRAATTLLDFPTLRDDDALAFTDMLNPLADGENTQDSQYANVVEVSHVFGKRVWWALHGEHFRQGPSTSIEKDFSLNSVGTSVQYRVPETLRWNRKVLDQVGVAANVWDISGDEATSADTMMPTFSASIALNVVPDPVHLLQFQHQTHVNMGSGDITTIDVWQDQTRATSVSGFSSLQYTHRPLERPRVRASAGVGYRSLLGLDESTSELQVVTNVFRRIGEGLDIGGQYQYRRPTGALTNLGRDEHRIQLALTFSTEVVFNRQFDDRNSVLNQEHGYIP